MFSQFQNHMSSSVPLSFPRSATTNNIELFRMLFLHRSAVYNKEIQNKAAPWEISTEAEALARLLHRRGSLLLAVVLGCCARHLSSLGRCNYTWNTLLLCMAKAITNTAYQTLTKNMKKKTIHTLDNKNPYLKSSSQEAFLHCLSN